MGWYFKPYVPVARRRAQAAQEVARRTRKGEKISPVVIEGRAIATTFWGRAWCTNLEGYSDYDNRLPRGRTYVRNGSVVDLKIEKGRIKALVSGSELYNVEITIDPAPATRWEALKKQSAGRIGSLVELLQGKLSRGVMELMTARDGGLFPAPREITMRCSCPDAAGMCKHLAAVMYGVGNRLDASPELLFLLRGVDHMELIEQAIPNAPRPTGRGAPTLASEELGAIFGIEVDDAPIVTENAEARKTPASKPTARKTAGAKTARAAAATIEPKPTVKNTAGAKTARAAAATIEPKPTVKNTAGAKTARAAAATIEPKQTARKTAGAKTARAAAATIEPKPTVKKTAGAKTARAAAATIEPKQTASKPTVKKTAVAKTARAAAATIEPRKAATARKRK